MATALSDVAFDDDMFMMSHSAYQPLDVSLLPELPLSADSVAVSDAILSKPAPAGQSQSRKRRYGSYLSGKSCLECYNRKRKCSGGRPCKHCVKLDRGHLCVDRNEENVPVPLRKKPRVELYARFLEFVLAEPFLTHAVRCRRRPLRTRSRCCSRIWSTPSRTPPPRWDTCEPHMC